MGKWVIYIKVVKLIKEFGCDYMNLIDMHMHSTYSDGKYTPKELIDMALKKGLNGMSITDHDTVEGLKEANMYAKEKNILFINGIEFSAFLDDKEIHILGYKIDYNNKNLIKMTKKLKDSRESRGIQIIKKLNELGLKIDDSDLYKYSIESIGRPHIANILIDKGYVKNKDEAFSKYIGNNCPAYVERYKLSISETIDLIKGAGGISVAAHPYLINNDEYLYKIIDMGIDGIEVYHSKHSYSTAFKYKYIAEKNNLYITGGSDFHGYATDFNYLGKVGIKRCDLCVLD